mgnify:CR=1 FL=1
MAGSLPRFPHLFMVKGETRNSWATSLTVRRSGRLFKEMSRLDDFLSLDLPISDIQSNIKVNG